jgi:hypothetical protein
MRYLVLLVLMVAPTACAVEVDLPVGEARVEIEVLNGLSVNGLSVNGLSVNGLSVNGLSVNGLSVNGLSVNGLAPDGLANSPYAAEFLRYAIRCALPAGQSLTYEEPGAIFVFHGLLGVAPGWAYGPATLDDERWVSACLLAHVNFYAVHVDVSLRGAHNGLATTPTELVDFPIDHEAFWGNIFRDPRSLVSCTGVAAGGSSSSPQRVCATSSVCGFQSVGGCALNCDASRTSCGGSSQVINAYLKL